jgi:hypothetical protein
MNGFAIVGSEIHVDPAVLDDHGMTTVNYQQSPDSG